MNGPPLVVIVGPPGAGKTTVAALVGDRLGVPVRDTDADIEERTGTTIANLFVDRGEEHFRVLEAEAVEEALGAHPGVLALGGGAVVHPRTRAALAGHRVVFLDVGLAEAASRIGMNASRPLLLGNVRSQMKALLDARRPLYTEVATHVVATDGVSADAVADRLVELLAAGKSTEGTSDG